MFERTSKMVPWTTLEEAYTGFLLTSPNECTNYNSSDPAVHELRNTNRGGRRFALVFGLGKIVRVERHYLGEGGQKSNKIVLRC